jgi:hypothetical protein
VRAFGLRVPVVLAAAAAVLGVLFLLQFLLQRQAVSVPLATRLREVPGVMGQPAVSENGGTLDVTVRLGLVPDLPATYHRLLQAAGADGSRVVLRVQDDPDSVLQADFDRLNVVLDQGRATGQFVQMDAGFDREAATLHLDRYALVLGQSHIFVTLVQGSHYLYEILPLTLAPGAAAATGGASAS